MTDFAKLVLDADTRGLKGAERDLKGLSREAGMTAQNIGKSMQKLGLGLTAGVSAPLGLFGKSAFQAAVDAQEMESAFDVVFGNMADDVRRWAETTGDAMGRSTQEIQRGALAFQELFGKALDPQQAAELSKEFAVLTQDLASFKNLSNEVAQQKLFSGLTGEAEPLRAVGVFINDAAVKAKALELGLGGVSGALTDQEKIIARGALIREQLAQADGDVLRTSESTANQIKASQAAFEELQITIGTKLLPAITPLISQVGAAFEWFSSLPDPVQNTSLAIAGIAVALGPVLTVLGTLVTLAPAIATGLGLIKAASLALMTSPPILAFAAVVTGIYLAWQNWDKIQPYIDAVANAVTEFWNGNVKPVFDALGRMIATAISWWFDWHRKGAEALAALGNSILSFHTEVIRTVYTIGRDMVLGLVEGIKANASAVWNALKSVVMRGVDNVKEFLGINSPSLLFMEIGGFMAEGLAIGLKNGGDMVAEAAQEMAHQAEIQTVKIADTFEQMAQSILGSLRGLASSIKSGDVFGILEGLVGLFTKAGSAGLFGQGVQNFLSSTPGRRANGGATSAGQTYLVGERGPELWTANANGFVTPSAGNDNGGKTIVINNSALADVYVDGRIQQAGPVIANGGSQLAQREMQIARSRSVRG